VLGFVLDLALLPTGREFLLKNPESTALIEEKGAEAARDERQIRHEQRWVPLARIAPSLKRAVIVAEDGAFYDHRGFDTAELKKVLRESWAKGQFPRGASTISQQLAKNLYLSSSKNPFRKLREAIITLHLERNLTKSRILELYLNVIEWGDGIYGAEAAAQFYFKKSAQELGASEAAFLAAIIPNPVGAYNPQKHPRRVRRKQAIILSRM